MEDGQVMIIIIIGLRIVGVVYCSNKAGELNRSKGGWGFFGFISPILAMIWIQFVKPVTIWQEVNSLKKGNELSRNDTLEKERLDRLIKEESEEKERLDRLIKEEREEDRLEKERLDRINKEEREEKYRLEKERLDKLIQEKKEEKNRNIKDVLNKVIQEEENNNLIIEDRKSLVKAHPNYTKEKTNNSIVYGIILGAIIIAIIGYSIFKIGDYSIIKTNEHVNVEKEIDYSGNIEKLVLLEDSRNFEVIKNLYAEKIIRYWNLMNISKDELKMQYEKSWNLTSNTKNHIQSIQKINAYNYELNTRFDYYHNKDKKNKSVLSSVKIVFDENGKISEIYGLKMEEIDPIALLKDKKLNEQEIRTVVNDMLPEWEIENDYHNNWDNYFVENGIKKYRTEDNFYPYLVYTDLNGDFKEEIAVKITKNNNSELVIIDVYNESITWLELNVDGLGITICECKNEIVESHWEENSVKLKNNGLILFKPESGSNLIYWDGSRYTSFTLTD